MIHDRAGKTLHDLWGGRAYLFSAETEAEAQRLLAIWAKDWVQQPILVQSLMMPDGHHRTTPPVLCGTWGGTCGATQWLDEPAFFLRQERVHDHVRTSQVWYINRRLKDNDRVRDQGGYRIECNQPYRHDGLCAPVELPGLTWTWEHEVVARENAARRKGIQHLPLVG